MDFCCDAIASSPSSWTGLSAPSFSHYFLEDVSEVFCEQEVPIIFSPGDSLDGIYMIVCPYSWPICDIDFCCDAIASSPSSRTGLSVPSFLHSFLEDILEVFCEHEVPIIFSPGDALDGVSMILCPSYWPICDMYLWCYSISSSTSS